MNNTLTAYETKHINLLINAMRTNTLLCNIESVSSSGMTRKLSFLTVSDNQVYRFNSLFMLDDYKLDKNGDVIVKGCGMDMVFATVYNMAHKLYGLGFISKEEVSTLAQSRTVII